MKEREGMCEPILSQIEFSLISDILSIKFSPKVSLLNSNMFGAFTFTTLIQNCCEISMRNF